MWSGFAGAIGKKSQEEQSGTGRYTIEEVEGKLVYKEGPLIGSFTWDGEWFVAKLSKAGKPEGTLRVRQVRRGLQSQYLAPDETTWDPAVVARRKPAPKVKKKPDPEKPAPVSLDDFLDGCCSPVAAKAPSQIPTSFRKQSSQLAPGPPRRQSSHSEQFFESSDSELPWFARPSVMTWNLSLAMVHRRNSPDAPAAEPEDDAVDEPENDAENDVPSGDMISFSTKRRSNTIMSAPALSAEELKEAVAQFQPQDVTESKIFELFKSIDKLKNGVLNRTEFFSGLWGKQANDLLKDLGVAEQHLSGTGHEVLQELFELADMDCDGVVTFHEFMSALKRQIGRDVDVNA